MILILIVLSVWICYVSTPTAERAKTAKMAGISYQETQEDIGRPQTPGERLEFSPVLTVVIVALGAVYLFDVFKTKGGLAALDLNTYNFMFLIAGMLLHWRPRSFLRAAAKAVPMTGGVLLQFPLYAGIFGVLIGSGLNEVMAKLFVSISTQGTLPLIGGIYSAILGLFLPSGGGKWVVESAVSAGSGKSAAGQSRVDGHGLQRCGSPAKLHQSVWMLPLMGLMGVKARDLAGYSTLQLIFHAPVVLLMLWLLGKTMPYVPPILS
jgi:short-chain fatty acids transporter